MPNKKTACLCWEVNICEAEIAVNLFMEGAMEIEG